MQTLCTQDIRQPAPSPIPDTLVQLLNGSECRKKDALGCHRLVVIVAPCCTRSCNVLDRALTLTSSSLHQEPPFKSQLNIISTIHVEG